MKRSYLRRQSKKHAREERQLAKAKKLVWLRCSGRCEAFHVLGWCDEWGAHPHHKLRRSHGGKHEPSNLIYICAQSHAWIHDNPRDAERLGLLIRSRGSGRVTVIDNKDDAGNAA